MHVIQLRYFDHYLFSTLLGLSEASTIIIDMTAAMLLVTTVHAGTANGTLKDPIEIGLQAQAPCLALHELTINSLNLTV